MKEEKKINAPKEETKTGSKNVHALNDDELEQVTGGVLFKYNPLTGRLEPVN